MPPTGSCSQSGLYTTEACMLLPGRAPSRVYILLGRAPSRVYILLKRACSLPGRATSGVLPHWRTYKCAFSYRFPPAGHHAVRLHTSECKANTHSGAVYPRGALVRLHTRTCKANTQKRVPQQSSALAYVQMRVEMRMHSRIVSLQRNIGRLTHQHVRPRRTQIRKSALWRRLPPQDIAR